MYIVQSTALINPMQTDLNEIESLFYQDFRYIFNPNSRGRIKQGVINDMLLNSSVFRQRLRLFVLQYIERKTITLLPNEQFHELILKQVDLLVSKLIYVFINNK